MNSLTFRPATLSDLPELMVMVHACRNALDQAGIDQWDDEYPTESHLRGDQEAGVLVVLTDGERLVGAVSVDQTFAPEWSAMNWSAAGEPAGAVHRLMVHPDYQGRGLARLLMEECEQIAKRRGYRSLRLDSLLKNPPAMSLYPRLGYQDTGRAWIRQREFAGFEKLLPPQDQTDSVSR